MIECPVLIVFSHLRWRFVYQRPQHLMTRFGQSTRVIFVEEPLSTTGQPHLVQHDAAPGGTVLQPHIELQQPGFSDQQNAALEALLLQYIDDEAIDDYALTNVLTSNCYNSSPMRDRGGNSSWSVRWSRSIRRLCRQHRTFITLARNRMRRYQVFSLGGMSACCHSLATNQLDSSVPPKRSNTWPPSE